jgi:integrase
VQAQSKAVGHLQVKERVSGLRWYLYWRDADGAHQRVLGKAWLKPKTNAKTPEQRERVRTATRNQGLRSWRAYWRAADGPAPAGYLTGNETEAEAKAILDKAPKTRTGRNGFTFADAAAAWLEDGKKRRALKPATVFDYRQVLDAYLLPAFGNVSISRITPGHVEVCMRERNATRTAQKCRMVAGAVLRSAGREDVATSVKPVKVSYLGAVDCFSAEELNALLRATEDDQQRAIILTAALTGLRRGEVVALTWRDVDFAQNAIRVRANVSRGQLVTPKSGKVRSVPMVDEIARALDGLSRRAHFTADDDPVFVNTVGGRLDASKLTKRYRDAVKRAGIRPLPYHSLRHFFGSMAVRKANIVQVQAWMGHSDVRVTSRYLHHASQATDAALLTEAFGREPLEKTNDTEGAEHAA